MPTAIVLRTVFRFGRKTVWLCSMLLLLVSAVVAAFMPSYWAFIACRSVSGVAVAGVITAGFVLSKHVYVCVS